MAEYDTGPDSFSRVPHDRPEGAQLDVASHPWAIAGLALAGGFLGTVVVKTLLMRRTLSTGEEPPIRVRNGSLDIEVLDDIDSWMDQDSAKPGRKWKLRLGKRRAGNRFRVIASLRQHTACKPHAPVVEATRIEITYSDGTEVSFTAAGSQTLIEVPTPGKRLTLAPHKCAASRCLEYDPGSGYVRRVVTRGPGPQLDCCFKSEPEFRGIYIFDW
jgi:hypothetical protein